MADVVASDVPKGTEVKWYGGGEVAQISHTVTAGEASAKGFALGETYVLEFGSVWCTINDVPTAVTENKTDISTAATESTGCDFVKFGTLVEGDVVVIYGVDISAVTLKHIASCKDIKSDSKASSSKESVHGQPTKLTTVGTVESTASLEGLMYTLEFVDLVFGDTLAASPATGWSKWSNKTHGFQKIGCLVGKRRDSSGVVIAKYFLVGATANSYGQSFPTEDMYKESFGFDCDYILRVRKG